VKYGIPVKHVLLDDHFLGKIGKIPSCCKTMPAWREAVSVRA
jgi:hypothetical protein